MTALLKQHLIDPVICIRCNTCEETCPVKAITHDSRNYVVDAGICNGCGDCLSPCPTGSIDNWRVVLRDAAYSLDEQLGWDELPAEADLAAVADAGALAAAITGSAGDAGPDDYTPPPLDAQRGSVVAPVSAATPVVNLYGLRQPALATVAGNVRVTATASDSDTHHIVLDFGSAPFPVLEGQSIGIIPPGVDAEGRPHHARQYSIASPRDGERPGYNNLSITVKRVVADHAGQPLRGVASNYVCDLQKGDQVRVIGPFGSRFLMPQDRSAHLLMICTGTGAAPMRGMTEARRRSRQPGDGRLMLFFGARSQAELPYFGPLMQLPKDFIDIHLAYSRAPGQPRVYVQDRLREQADAVAALLRSERTHVYVCGLKGMEDGVLDALRAIADGHGLDWKALHRRLRDDGRLHLETY